MAEQSKTRVISLEYPPSNPFICHLWLISIISVDLWHHINYPCCYFTSKQRICWGKFRLTGLAAPMTPQNGRQLNRHQLTAITVRYHSVVPPEVRLRRVVVPVVFLVFLCSLGFGLRICRQFVVHRIGANGIQQYPFQMLIFGKLVQ